MEKYKHKELTDIIFKELDGSDFSFLKEIISEFTEKTISDSDLQNRISFIMNSPFEQLYLYVEDNVRKGIVATRIRENIEENSKFLEISLIVTKKEFQKQNIGKQMILFCEEQAKTLNCVGLWLVSGFGKEESAHQFYNKQGFTKTGYRFKKDL
ncbi:MAG: GNAT family N-acetyltransferase [Prevotellaceae bacterium]|jgi:GNAT superfamily N-acetyltransferase|nr:GNAT family N-acetyltransferase [Prevotellaceae bacterium]